MPTSVFYLVVNRLIPDETENIFISKLFFRKEMIKSMISANSLDLNSIENLNVTNEKSSSTKNGLSTAILESWNHFGEEFCSESAKSIPEEIKSVIKAQGEMSK